MNYPSSNSEIVIKSFEKADYSELFESMKWFTDSRQSETNDEIWLVDDRSSSISLPEVPLLGVLPGTGGLTRVVGVRSHVLFPACAAWAGR